MELDNLQDNIVIVAAVAALIGLGIGALLTWLTMGRGPSKTELTTKLTAVEEEFKTHKGSVDKHFATTSELVNELTESYVKVYKHLSDGAQHLGGVTQMRHRLTLDDGDAAPAASESSDSAVIEGALATAAVATVGAVPGAETTAPSVASPPPAPKVAMSKATALKADDPEFTVSDAAVEEALNELEANATGGNARAAAELTDTTSDNKSSAKSASKSDSASISDKR